MWITLRQYLNWLALKFTWFSSVYLDHSLFIWMSFLNFAWAVKVLHLRISGSTQIQPLLVLKVLLWNARLSAPEDWETLFPCTRLMIGQSEAGGGRSLIGSSNLKGSTTNIFLSFLYFLYFCRGLLYHFSWNPPRWLQ